MDYTISKIPLFQELEKSNNILIAGMGGGFDIYSSIPLYFALKKLGKNIVLGNFSFTWLDETNSKSVFPFCYEIESIDEDLSGRSYFPEKHLKQWFEDNQEIVRFFAFDRIGAKPLSECYAFLKDKFDLDTILLVDGGTGIVANSIKSALEGEYGNYHATHRTQGSQLWINPLMTIYWCFEINALASKIEYLETIKDSKTIGEFNQGLALYRDNLKELRFNKQIPI